MCLSNAKLEQVHVHVHSSVVIIIIFHFDITEQGRIPTIPSSFWKPVIIYLMSVPAVGIPWSVTVKTR